ncbi:MAG: type II toxin-antitoxin system VapC family toxin [Patescibacteria group bacterium]|nr:type II toxin-antitoxin system VapC family toxin [Patescibacteria group bacterium]
MDNYIFIDTDILIDVGRNVKDAVARLIEEEKSGILAISVITQMELIVGCKNKKEMHYLEQFIQRFTIISLSEEISKTAADLLYHYRLSHGLLIADAFIAATAIKFNSPLLTKNQKDYKFIKELNLMVYPA